MIPEAHLGGKVRCPGCSAAFEPVDPVPEEGAPAAAPASSKPADREAWRAPTSDTKADPGEKAETFQIKILHDSAKEAGGVWRATITPKGLELKQENKEDLTIPAKSRAEFSGGGKFQVSTKGREFKFGVSQLNIYQERLARDLVTFLKGKGRAPKLSDYTIPWYLLALAFLPAGIGAVSLTGGALGGAVGGAITGGLIGGNIAIIKREKLPFISRIAISLCLTTAGYALLAWVVIVAIRKLPETAPAAANAPKPAATSTPAPSPSGHEISGWGTFEDPSGDCRVETQDKSLAIEVPGTIHNLVLNPNQTMAPRVLRPVSGDFVVQVKLVGDPTPADPPAEGSNVAYHGAGLLLWGDDTNFIRLERAAFTRAGRVRKYVLNEHLSQGPAQTGMDMDYQPGHPVWLRMERRGSQILTAFSQDGASWQFFSPRFFNAAPAKIGVAAVNTASAPFRAEFEEFRVEP
ncbi:DUF1349 domain-containing protein [Singulisphaera sp. PoT]|uniref:DUF1349 domain-containing protein n=1 Tax=Singulisphaera sp. PoT TaxID=3411797 RepID=UPI003BF60B8D